MKTDRELLERALGVLEATNSEQKSPVDSLEKQNAIYRQRLKDIEGAEAALDSERECNAKLTKELEVQEKSCACPLQPLCRGCDDPVEHWTDLDPGTTDGIEELHRDIDKTAERLEKDIEDKRHGR